MIPIKASTETLIPIMTSNITPNGVVDASSSISTTWRLFDGNHGTEWISANQYTQWVSYKFTNNTVIVGYSITSNGAGSGQAPAGWIFQGLEASGAWVNLHSVSGVTRASWQNEPKKKYSFNNNNEYGTYRIVLDKGTVAIANRISLSEIEMFGLVPDYKSLIFQNGMFFYYRDAKWNSLAPSATEQDYLSYGMDDISIVPEEAWQEFMGEVEICYFTDDTNVFTVSFNVTTEPFTLGDEWANKEIQIIEYTDDPNQTESSITLETEPFTLYDELGDNVDVLYYTDDPSVTDPKLNITANYSPLDELEGDFDVVTWSDSDTVPNIESSFIPSPQVVVHTEPYTVYGDLLAVVSKLTSENGKLRFAVSFNGREWKSWRYGEWRTIDIHDLPAFKQDGMSHYDLNRMKSSELAKYDSIQLAYYIEDNIHNSDQGTSLDAMQLKVDAATDTARLEGLVFNVVNTKATIQLSLSGNKLSGKLEDSDMGKIQYRILLNGVPYFPSDGQFTPLAPSPLHIDFNVSERDIKFNQLNTLKVEYRDYWGDTDDREISFTGAYSGLMFMDESGEYLSDTFGGILKYLDFDVIFAGQTTIDQKVLIKNQLGYPVDELLLKVNESKLPEGVQIELSRQQSPFLPTNYITYGYTDMDQTQEFYVRIVTDLNAKTIPDGIFELKLNAKRTT